MGSRPRNGGQGLCVRKTFVFGRRLNQWRPTGAPKLLQLGSLDVSGAADMFSYAEQSAVEESMAQVKTKAAFDQFRAGRAVQSMHPDAVRFGGDTDPMGGADGLRSWEDGADKPAIVQTEVPAIAAEPPERRLWVILPTDVLHAPEKCPFGAARGATKVKHSNLTGGGPAFGGGELVFLDAQSVVINGCSGRYRIQSEADMQAVASAFRKSGYMVWSMGWDSDTSRPALFGTKDPVWIDS